MDLRVISLSILFVIFLKNSECQLPPQQFCQSAAVTLPLTTSVRIFTSESVSRLDDFSNDGGDCGCELMANGNMSAAIHITSRLSIPDQNVNRKDDDSVCGPYVKISRKTETGKRVISYQCPLPRRENDTAMYVVHLKPAESVFFALINVQKQEVKGNFSIIFLYGELALKCGHQTEPESNCPCTDSGFGIGPRTGNTELAQRFVAAIVVSVLFLALCAIVFGIYMFIKKRREKKEHADGGPTPEKSNIDGAENNAYSGSQKSLDKAKKPEIIPRSKHSPDKMTPEKEDTNTSYIRCNSNDALNLSLQQPNGNTKGLSSIIGAADVRGSTESGIYSSADLIGPDQMYGPNGTPQRPKPGLPPRTPSKEDLDPTYAKIDKQRPPPSDYYSNVPGVQSPFAHLTGVLPPGPQRSASQDRLDAGRRAGSVERLDATPMTRRVPSIDRLDASVDNGAFVPEQQYHGSLHSLSQTDV